MASDFVIQTLLHDVRRSLRPMLAHWLSTREWAVRKEEQILRYLHAVANADKRARELAQLEPAARALLAHCCAQETPVPAGVAIARASSAGYDVSPATLGALHLAGFAFLDSPAYWPGNSAWSVEHAHQDIIAPAAVCASGLVCERAALQLPRCQATLPADAEAASARVAALITACLQAVSDGAVRMTQDGVFAVRTQRAMEALWARRGAPAAPDAYAIVAFLRAAGIVQLESSGAIAPTAAFARERERPAPAHVAALLNFQLAQLSGRTAGIEEYGFAPEPYAASTLHSVLLALEPGDAVRVADCTELVHARATAMTRGGAGTRGWSWPRSTQPVPTRAQWYDIVRRVLDNMYLAHGVAVECVNCPHGPCVALTKFGHFWLRGEAAPAHHHEHQQLIVQPDFTALLTHTGPWDRTAHVLRIFGAQSGDDNASIFRFSRERVQAAVRHGHDVQELLDLLAARASYPVPDNVRITLQEWGAAPADAVLHRDANVLEFESRAARDAFIRSNTCTAKPIGEQFVLLCVPQHAALDVMQTLAALPVDYAQPPTAGIVIAPDGSISTAAPHDLRIVALREAIAAPAPPLPGRTEPRWRVSARRLRACNEPAQLFEQLLRLPGSPLPPAVRVQFLVLLGLLPHSPGGRYAVVENLTANLKSQLKKHIPWRQAVVYDATPLMAVIAAPFVPAVRTACAALGIELIEVAIEPPPFEIHD